MRSSLYNLKAFQAALTAARILPRCVTQNVAQVIGRVSYAKARSMHGALRNNLAVVTGESGPQLDALCARNVVNFSRMLADYFYCASRGGERAGTLLEQWRGFEHLAAARERGKGTIIVTAHLGNWELGGILLAMRDLKMTVVTLDEPTTALTEWRDRYRRALGIKTIAVGPGREFAFVEMIQTLRKNECVAMLVDRPYQGTGTPVQFFGRETQFSSAPALLWQHTDASVVPAFVVRSGAGRYVSFAEPAIELTRSPDPRSALAANTQTIASVFQSIIQRYPDQWFNYVPIWPTPSHDTSA